MRDVILYFDFVSPYSWLGLECARGFAEEHGVRWDLRPIVYAKLLEANGLLGPAETDAKRRYTFFDVVRCARRLGLRVQGPPAHPFRSLDALRVATLFRTEAQALDVVVGLAHACWADGRELGDPGVLAEVVESVGLDPARLQARTQDAAVKNELRRLTDGALELGVFGVPSFVLDGEIFWGHDRLDYLAERLADPSRPSDAVADRLLARPRAVVRRRTDPSSSPPAFRDQESVQQLRRRFEAWLDAYGRAWERRDEDGFVALFSREADYHWTPFGPPKRGREGIRAAFREAVATQRDIQFSREVLAVDEQLAVAHWTCRFVRRATDRPVMIDGILTASFGADGLCNRFREWWHREEAD